MSISDDGTASGAMHAAMNPVLRAAMAASIRTVHDFPTPGIPFKDITPLLADPVYLAAAVQGMSAPFAALGVTHVVAMESRGFIFGAPMALHLGAAFVPARKPGKLPWQTIREAYALEYGENVLELHTDALGAGARVLIVDDVLATGGTAAAAVALVRRLAGDVVGASFLIELPALAGRDRLPGIPTSSMLSY